MFAVVEQGELKITLNFLLKDLICFNKVIFQWWLHWKAEKVLSRHSISVKEVHETARVYNQRRSERHVHLLGHILWTSMFSLVIIRLPHAATQR